MRKLPHTRSCFVCGEANPLGLQLRFETDGRCVRAAFTPRAEHVGFQQTVHGGILSTLLDEIMVWACAVQTKQFSFCAELTVRFQQPVQPGQPTFAFGELTANRRDRLFEARAELRDSEDRLLVSGHGKYLPIKKVDRSSLLSDFVGEAGEFLPQD